MFIFKVFHFSSLPYSTCPIKPKAIMLSIDISLLFSKVRVLPIELYLFIIAKLLSSAS